ncbi:Uncharacterised protein [Escherichia coli]|nr:Uncharacterised protein [Escherichia coli]VTQ22705.1 Uncharacterised protein [Escherichia coli]
MTVISSMICRADVEYTRQLLKPHSAVRLADISGWGIAMVPVWNPVERGGWCELVVLTIND